MLTLTTFTTPVIQNDTVSTQAELGAPDLAAALIEHPRLTQLELRWSAWLPAHLPCLEPLSGAASAKQPNFTQYACIRRKVVTTAGEAF